MTNETKKAIDTLFALMAVKADKGLKLDAAKKLAEALKKDNDFITPLYNGLRAK